MSPRYGAERDPVGGTSRLAEDGMRFAAAPARAPA